MALKGTATIELTDIKTGTKEVIKHDNLVTNAIHAALSTPFAYDKQVEQPTYTYSRNLLPLCPNLVGGILLYEDALEEDAAKYFAKFDNKLIGYSSKDVSDSTDRMRGSMNQTESGPLEDGSGYRFVFDFGTDQANGTISSVGLTSKWGGVSGLGSKEVKNCRAPYVYVETKTIKHADFSDINLLNNVICYKHLIHYDQNSEIGTSVFMSSPNVITIGRIKLPTQKWWLGDPMDGINLKRNWDISTIETKVFSGPSSSGTRAYYTFCDGRDGCIWGFEHSGRAAGNSSGKASVNWIKIKLEDLSFEEGTWEIDAQIYQFGTHAIRTSDPIYTNTSQSNHAIISDGRLFCYSYDLTGVYVINLSNITDVKLLKHPDGQVATYSDLSSTSYDKATSDFCLIGNNVCFWNGYINVDEIVPCNCTASYTQKTNQALGDGYIDGASSTCFPGRHGEGHYGGIQSGVYAFQYFYMYNDGLRLYVNLMPTYLATINNLPVAVEKTADKTMKITYILREES